MRQPVSDGGAGDPGLRDDECPFSHYRLIRALIQEDPLFRFVSQYVCILPPRDVDNALLTEDRALGALLLG